MFFPRSPAIMSFVVPIPSDCKYSSLVIASTTTFTFRFFGKSSFSPLTFNSPKNVPSCICLNRLLFFKFTQPTTAIAIVTARIRTHKTTFSVISIFSSFANAVLEIKLTPIHLILHSYTIIRSFCFQGQIFAHYMLWQMLCRDKKSALQ